MRIEDLQDRTVALLGLGTDVRAAIPAIFAALPKQVLVVDDAVVADPAGEAADDAVDEVDAAHYSHASSRNTIVVEGHSVEVVDLAEACARSEVMVRSPGFPRYLPELVEARERGVGMTTPVDLFLAGLAESTRVVLITGTKGKSTTTDLVRRFADEVDMRVGVAGNLGIPVFAKGWDSTAPVIILEVSSYQASDLHSVPDIAVITSIAEDHLSWHGGLDRYLRDKLRVVANDGRCAGRVLVPRSESRAIEVLAEQFPDLQPVLVEDVDASGSAPVQRVRNASLAAAVIAELGGPAISRESILDAASAGIPGRLDRCVSPRGLEDIRFLDDALASNPAATAAGLAWARSLAVPTLVILGGYSRGVSLEPLRNEIARWSETGAATLRAVVLPDNGAEVARSCEIEIVGAVESVGEAVVAAVNALGVANAGVVLFSPAAPTPARYGNWKTRSDEFRTAIAELSRP